MRKKLRRRPGDSESRSQRVTSRARNLHVILSDVHICLLGLEERSFKQSHCNQSKAYQ